jgi:hypothetical protein
MLVLVVSSSGQTSSNSGAPSPNSGIKSQDMSDWLFLMLAAQGGGGLLSNPTGTTAYGGAKIGFGPGILSLGYDRIQAHNGFCIDGSALLPVVRFPGPQRDTNFVRIYAEPGVGDRAGSGRFGGYLSAKVMVALLSNQRLTGDTWKGSPFLEVERRFPFNALGGGDTRITFGFMLAISSKLEE